MPHPGAVPARRGAACALFLLAALSLFLELALIRYLGGTVWNLGYFPNLVLISAFIGLGAGFVFHVKLSESQSALAFGASAALTAALIAFVTFLHPGVPGFTQWQGDIGNELFFTSLAVSAQKSAWQMGVCFLLIVAIFAAIAQRIAKQFAQFAPLRAYTVDILGSCCGIVAFMAIGWLHIAAPVWFIAYAALHLACLVSARGRGAWLCAAALPILLVCVYRQDQTMVIDERYDGPLAVAWSPYQRIEYLHEARKLTANGIPHQTIEENAQSLRESFYQVVHAARAQGGAEPYRTVLIIGAGTGNDVAAALANGATHVDAVEIDPVIAQTGREQHPLKPYDDPRVTVTVDDGRAFITRTARGIRTGGDTKQYDLVIFALTDSLVKVSPMAQLRLENFLFTTESVSDAWALLNPGGDLVFYNHYRTQWLADKMQHLAASAGGAPRVLWNRYEFYVISTTKPVPPKPGEIRAPTHGIPPAYQPLELPTDDWPFLYLKRHGMPSLYIYGMLIISLIVGLLLWLYQKKIPGASNHPMPLKLAFVLTGVAFLLLETKSIIRFGLLFGTTWYNSSLVILGVLLLVLAANATAHLIRSAALLWFAYAGLLVSCVAALAVPLSDLLAIEDGVARFAAAATLTFAPVYFANLIFSVSFRDQQNAETLFGWNILGATLGGVLEYTSMAVGYAALGWLVLALYTVAVVLLAKARRSAAIRPGPSS